jgi:glycerol uptake facilitator-like aquaporin
MPLMKKFLIEFIGTFFLVLTVGMTVIELGASVPGGWREGKKYFNNSSESALIRKNRNTFMAKIVQRPRSGAVKSKFIGARS